MFAANRQIEISLLQTNGLYKFTLLPQLNWGDSQTSHNVHAQRKEQKHQKHYPFKGTPNQHGGLKLSAATDSVLADYTSRLPKHTDLTPSATQNMPRWHPPLVKISLVQTSLIQIWKSPASAAYLNSQLQAGSPLWPVSLVTVSADHRYR